MTLKEIASVEVKVHKRINEPLNYLIRSYEKRLEDLLHQLDDWDYSKVDENEGIKSKIHLIKEFLTDLRDLEMRQVED